MAGGGGASSSVTVEAITPEAARVWGLEAVQETSSTQNAFLTAYQVLLGLIGTYGVIAQSQRLDDMVELNERQVVVAERYVGLAEDNYRDVTLETFERQRDLFDRYVTTFQAFEQEFVDEARRLIEYIPRYSVQEGRAVANVGMTFGALRRRRQLQRSRYDCGAHANESLIMDMAEAAAGVDALNRGYRYEDEKKLQLDQWYWSRYTTFGQFVDGMRAHVITGINGGAAGATQGIHAITGAVGQMGQAVQGMTSALGDQASFFGSLSNGAFTQLGFLMGQQSVPTIGSAFTQGPMGASGTLNGGPTGLVPGSTGTAFNGTQGVMPYGMMALPAHNPTQLALPGSTNAVG